METPRLRLALYQISPALPDPHEFVGRINESIRFIDENPRATLQDLSPEMLGLWCIAQQEVETLRTRFDCIGELDLSPETVSSLIIFAHIYLKHYRLEDFADLGNFADYYISYQELLYRAKTYYTGNNFKLFDLENIAM